MSGHDPLCQTRTDTYPSWCDCPRVQAIRTDERERTLNDPGYERRDRRLRGEALADLRAKVLGLPSVSDFDPYIRRADVLALLSNDTPTT